MWTLTMCYNLFYHDQLSRLMYHNFAQELGHFNFQIYSVVQEMGKLHTVIQDVCL